MIVVADGFAPLRTADAASVVFLVRGRLRFPCGDLAVEIQPVTSVGGEQEKRGTTVPKINTDGLA